MADVDAVAIGLRLRTLRGKLSQSAFGERLGLTYKSIARYETGERAPDAQALVRLMDEFGVDPAWVLTGSGVRATLTDDERELLVLYRNSSAPGRAAARAALAASHVGSASGGPGHPQPADRPVAAGQTFHGHVTQAINGPVTQRDLVINVGGNRGGRRKK
ncbi:MAG: helix-turn-helix transcriptional regulator [Alphaproteobacteria bacterium]|nr:helix-turn-helix transcriptional regulator [Alphaproteobacteria bacterium]